MYLKLILAFLLPCLLCAQAHQTEELKDSSTLSFQSFSDRVFSDSYEYSVGNLDYYRPFFEPFYEKILHTSIPHVREKRARLMETSKSIFSTLDTPQNITSPLIPYITHRVWITNHENPYEIPQERLEMYFKTLQNLGKESTTSWAHYFWCLDKNKIPQTIQTLQNSGLAIQIRELKEIWPSFRGKDIFERLYQGKYYTAISDIVRFNLVYLLGGVYSDFGVLFNKDLTTLFNNYDYLFGQEGYLAGTSFLAGAAKAPVFNEILKFIDTLERVPQEYRSWGDHIVTPRWTALGILTLMMDAYTRESDRILPIPYGPDSLVKTNHMGSWLGNTPQFGQVSLQKNPISQETFFGTQTIFDQPYRFDPNLDPMLNFSSQLAKELYNTETEVLIQNRALMVENSKKAFYSVEKPKGPGIPHITHRCWITNPKKPNEAPVDKLQMYLDSLQILDSTPDWQHIFWCINPDQIPQTIEILTKGNPKIQVHSLQEIFPLMRGKAIFDAMFEDNRYCNANDITRLNILHLFGGLYADLGFTFHKDLTPFLDTYDRIFLLYDWGNIDHNMAGVKPGDRIINKHLDSLDTLHLLPENIKSMTPDAYSQMVWTGSHHFMVLLDLLSQDDKTLFLPSDGRFLTQVRGQTWGKNASFGNKPIAQSDLDIFKIVRKNINSEGQRKIRVYSPKWSNPYADYSIAMNSNDWTNLGDFLNGELLKSVIPSSHLVSSPLALRKGDIFLVEATNVLHEWHPEWAESVKKELEEVHPEASVVVVSVGTQAPDIGSMINIHPCTVEILKEFLQRSKSIGVRGEYTQKALEKHGIQTTPVGSYALLNQLPSPDLLKRKSKVEKVGITAAFDSFNPLSQHAVMAFGVQKNATYIALTEKELLQWPSISTPEEVLKRLEKYGSNVTWDQLTLYSRFIETKPSHPFFANLESVGIKTPYFEDFIKLIQKNIVTPKNLKDWQRIAKEQDLIVSSRFEGVIAGLLAGTRSLCIAHDVYTEEACRTMNIPFIKSLNVLTPLQELYDLADPTGFIRHYETYRENYYRFLEMNNVPVVKTSNPFADSPLLKATHSDTKVFCDRWTYEPYYDFSSYNDAEFDWNIGELLFAQSAKRLFPPYHQAQAATDLKKGDTYAIVVSNVLNPWSEGWSQETLAKLEEVNPDSSVVVICMGAQAPSTDTTIDLPDPTISLLKKIAQRSSSIGVRGRYTQQLLERYGIPSRVVGCPSLLFSPIPVENLRQHKETIQKIAVGATLYSDNPVIQHSLLWFMLKNQGDYFIQTEKEFLDWKKLKSPNEVIERLEDFSAKLESLPFDQKATGYRYIETKSNHPTFEALKAKGIQEGYFKDLASAIRTRSVMPQNLEDWIHKLQTYDLVISSRIHGVIAGLLSGTRSLCIAHDSRTQELCETLKIPYLKDFEPNLSAEYYYNMADPTAFLENYPAYRENYKAFFQENHLPAHFTE